MGSAETAVPLCAAPDAGGSRPTALPRAHVDRLQASRRVLLEAVGRPDDLTFVRGIGNVGDRLIWAGTRRLLAGLPYREIGHAQLPDHRGHTAVLCGGGGWCAAYHGTMPRLLELAAARFERVIVLPSSFDPAVTAVREALRRTRAIVFAREAVSWELVRDLCDARLAHDAAFFADLTTWRRPGRGVLHAYRTDRESTRAFPLPPHNADVSFACATLDAWLSTIARHAVVRTDRAHVMIAAALLGKRVEVRPSSYHKVPALAAWALGDFDVRVVRGEGAGFRPLDAVRDSRAWRTAEAWWAARRGPRRAP